MARSALHDPSGANLAIVLHKFAGRARPESISRLVRRLEEKGLLKFDKRRVRFTDMEAVLREACVLY